MPHEIIWIWYTGRWLVGCHIWYSQETTGRGPQPAQAPPHCTSHRPIFTILGEMTHAHKRANPIQCIMGATGQTSGCGFGLTMIRVFDWATVWWRKYVWPYVKLFQQNTGTWWTNGQTDRQTDKIAISISRVSVLTRDNNDVVCTQSALFIANNAAHYQMDVWLHCVMLLCLYREARSHKTTIDNIPCSKIPR